MTKMMMPAPTPQDFQTAAVSQRNLRALDEVDQMPRALRECVHEFGYPIVKRFLQIGVTNPAHITATVREIWMGGRHTGQRVGKPRSRTPVGDHIDLLLLRSGADLSCDQLVMELYRTGFAIVQHPPSPAMVEASVRTVRGGDSPGISITEKHKRRLRAAIEAAIAKCWPDLHKRFTP